MKFITDRREISSVILQEIKPDYSDNDIDLACTTWWQNPRKIGGLMLNKIGDAAFKAADIECVDYPSDRNTISQYLGIMLDRYMICPHFVDFSKYNYKDQRIYIRVYDTRVALMIDLYGDFHTYFNTLMPKD